MSFLLDTDHLSAHLRRPSGLAHRFFQYSGRLYTPSIALAELYVWAYRRSDPTEALEASDRMLFHEVSVVNYDGDCAREFGSIGGLTAARPLCAM
jgi:predicted nucleic acid-binding protein